ncbi:YSIRK-type signal peptide-containing protein [Ligilactobacillus murinus]|uniref:mucin-binding protein n=1 Tax=Ligilactobacillus murinus TaxID=1622 RepID=UPI0035173AF2
MLSRNNNKLLIHKLEPKKQRFAIRKISVGVASVLIGFTFAGFSGVSADEATTTTKDHLKTEATTESSSVPTKEVELTSGTETQAKEAKTTPVADAKAQVTEDVKEQAPTQTVTAKETSEAPTSLENQTVAPATEDEASETQPFNVEKQAEPQANVDLTDSKVAYAATPTKAQDQQEEGFSVTDPDYSKYSYAGTNLQTLIDDFKIDYQNSEYVFQWIASTNGERGIVFTVDRGKDADGNVILTNNGSFNAYEYHTVYRGWPIWGNYTTEVERKKYVIRYGNNELDIGRIINDGSRNTITVDHFYTKNSTLYTPVFVGGHSGIEEISGNGYGVLSIYTPQVVEQKAKINNGEVYKTQTGLTGQHYTTGIPKNAKVEKGKFLYAKNSQGTMSEFHKGVVLVNNYHDGVTVVYKELDNQGTMEVNVYDNSKYPVDKYTMKVGETREYGNVTIANPYVQQTTDITYEYRKLGSVELYDENGNYLDQKQYVNDANDAAKASLPKIPKEFTRGNIEYTLVKAKDLPSDLSRSIKYIYRGIETKVTQDTYTLTTEFVNENGKELKAAERQTITWTTTTKRDIHTNKITKQTSPSKESYAAVNSPVILGYYATTTKLSGQKAEPKNTTQKIIYHKLGKIIAQDSQGNILTTVDYENAAADATKIKEIVAPTIKGHHVKGEVIQPSDLGQDTVLNYGQDTQVAQIKYWDETAQKYITDAQGDDLETIETGAHNTEISHKKVTEQIHALKAKGYEYDVTDQRFSRVYFDDDDSKIQTFTVKLVHGMQAEIESKHITREVHIHHPKQEKEVVPQTATLTRNVTRDKVTDEVSPTSAWNFANFEEVDLPSHKGYKIDETPAEIQNGKVVAKTVTPDEEDGKKIAVKYIPLEQHALVKYVDDNNGTLLAEEDIQGVTDAAIEHTNDEKIATYRAKGYELVFDELANESDPHFNAEDEAKVYTVHLKHGSKVVKVDPSNVNSQKEVKRMIIVNSPDGTKTTKVQTVVFTRDGLKDLVTGKISYPDWDEIATKAFPQDDVPQYLGYTSIVAGRKQTTIAARNVRPTDADQEIEVSYVARPSKQVITYQDENGNQIKTQVVTGRTGETVKLVPVLPDGWELTAPDSFPEKVTFAPEENQVLVITVKRITTTASAKTETSGENPELAKQEVVNDPTGVTTNEKNEATLPQLGESDSEALAVSLLGLVTAAFSLFYFGKERRKTDN